MKGAVEGEGGGAGCMPRLSLDNLTSKFEHVNPPTENISRNGVLSSKLKLVIASI